MRRIGVYMAKSLVNGAIGQDRQPRLHAAAPRPPGRARAQTADGHPPSPGAQLGEALGGPAARAQDRVLGVPW
jgi:hypothetical protein